jgi:hypothetical protein
MMTMPIKPFGVMPAKAGIHDHGPVSMDTGFRRYDSGGCIFLAMLLEGHRKP